MPGLHISTDQVTAGRFWGFSRICPGREPKIELLDDVIQAREQIMIDKALREINEGGTYDLDSVGVELCDEDQAVPYDRDTEIFVIILLGKIRIYENNPRAMRLHAMNIDQRESSLDGGSLRHCRLGEHGWYHGFRVHGSGTERGGITVEGKPCSLHLPSV